MRVPHIRPFTITAIADTAEVVEAVAVSQAVALPRGAVKSLREDPQDLNSHPLPLPFAQQPSLLSTINRRHEVHLDNSNKYLQEAAQQVFRGTELLVDPSL